MKKLGYFIEGKFLLLITIFFSILPIKIASFIGGVIASSIGYLLPLHTIAKTNILIAFPTLNKKEKKKIIYKQWQNIGRTFAELPHLKYLKKITNKHHKPGWSINGEQYLKEAKETNRAIIFFSGHIGNWEILPLALAEYGLPFASLYRAPNNPYADNLLKKIRSEISHHQPLFSKGKKGTIQAANYLKKKKHIGILGDQKMNDGVKSYFFSYPAMTTSATEVLARKFNAIIITGHISRHKNCQFTVNVDPVIYPEDFPHDDKFSITDFLNRRLESWIKEKPHDWLWIHRRWDKKNYKK